jgi:hypothetical protein
MTKSSRMRGTAVAGTILHWKESESSFGALVFLRQKGVNSRHSRAGGILFGTSPGGRQAPVRLAVMHFLANEFCRPFRAKCLDANPERCSGLLPIAPLALLWRSIHK